MCSNVSPDWIQSYIRAAQMVVEIFKMDDTFQPDIVQVIQFTNAVKFSCTTYLGKQITC